MIYMHKWSHRTNKIPHLSSLGYCRDMEALQHGGPHERRPALFQNKTTLGLYMNANIDIHIVFHYIIFYYCQQILRNLLKSYTLDLYLKICTFIYLTTCLSISILPSCSPVSLTLSLLLSNFVCLSTHFCSSLSSSGHRYHPHCASPALTLFSSCCSPLNWAGADPSVINK